MLVVGRFADATEAAHTAHRWRDGQIIKSYTAEAIARRRQLSELIRMARVTLAEFKERR